MGLRVVGRYLSLPEAHAVRCALESGGILAFVFDTHFGNMLWAERMVLGGFRVAVPERDLPDARAFLKETVPPAPVLDGGTTSLNFWMCLLLAGVAWGAGWSWVAYRDRPTPWRATGFLVQFFGFLALDLYLLGWIIAFDISQLHLH